MRRLFIIPICAALALAMAACHPNPTGGSVGPIDFEEPDYSTGNINGQDGWVRGGSYDHEVDDEALFGTSPDDFGFGEQALRISSGVTSGSFDQTVSKPTSDHAGETTGDGGGQVGGTRRGFFETSWSFADAGNPLAEQEDLVVQASPDRGDGSRMSFIQMADCSNEDNDAFPVPPCVDDGLEVNFYEYDPAIGPAGANGGFVTTTVASGLSRLDAHTIRMRIWFFEGIDNDVVEVCVDGTECSTGGSWEDFYRELGTPEPSKLIDSVQFHTRTSNGECTCDGNGFFIDDFVAKSFTYTGANLVVSGPSTVNEGNAGTSDATYTITLSEPLPFDVSVPYNTADGTATAGSDYTETSDTATFAAGETEVEVTVPVSGDTTDEPHETFSLNLGTPVAESRNPGLASGTFVFNHVSSKTTSIRDEESTIRVSNSSVNEPTSGSVLTPFTVSLDNASSQTVTVHFATEDGSAMANGDYAAREDVTVTFPAGQTSKTVNVSVRADPLVEGNEVFEANLFNPTNGVIADSLGVGTIFDADD